MQNKKKNLTLENYFVTLGNVYHRGIALEKDDSKAFSCFKKAAEGGNATGLSQLGSCYEEGIGTSINLARALDCYEDAYDRGDIKGTYKLGDCYWDGLETILPADRTKAYELYIQALKLSKERNDVWNAPDVYYRIARCLYEGIGTQLDIEGALSFYTHAYDGYYNRIETGDIESESLLEESEQKINICRNDLGIHSSTNDFIPEA